MIGPISRCMIWLVITHYYRSDICWRWLGKIISHFLAVLQEYGINQQSCRIFLFLSSPSHSSSKKQLYIMYTVLYTVNKCIILTHKELDSLNLSKSHPFHTAPITSTASHGTGVVEDTPQALPASLGSTKATSVICTDDIDDVTLADVRAVSCQIPKKLPWGFVCWNSYHVKKEGRTSALISWAKKDSIAGFSDHLLDPWYYLDPCCWWFGPDPKNEKLHTMICGWGTSATQ